jgi:hypothetical protein
MTEVVVDPVVAAAGFLVVALIVGAVGVALGILLAPRIGRLAERADGDETPTDETQPEERGDDLSS